MLRGCRPLPTTLLLTLAFGLAQACAEELDATVYEVPQKFAGKDGRAAKDLSGIACSPSGDALRCLVVNDESTSAQWATIDGTSLVAGEEVALIGEDIDETILGAKPRVDCANGEGEYGELDGEAMTFAPPYFYVVGSHGCSRAQAEFRPSSFILARVSTTGDEDVMTTFRLTDVLRRAEGVGSFFGKRLDNENGLNIEGLAVRDGNLIAGLRAPSIDGKAFLVRTDIAALFAPGHAPGSASPQVFQVAVPAGSGIRDLATLSDGRLLLLLGPAQEQGVPYSLMRIELPAAGNPNVTIHGDDLGELPEVSIGDNVGKAEGIAVLSSTPTELEVLVLFDGLKNGAPRAYRIALP